MSPYCSTDRRLCAKGGDINGPVLCNGGGDDLAEIESLLILVS